MVTATLHTTTTATVVGHPHAAITMTAEIPDMIVTMTVMVVVVIGTLLLMTAMTAAPMADLLHHTIMTAALTGKRLDVCCLPTLVPHLSTFV